MREGATIVIVDVTGLFEGPDLELPSEDEWRAAQALCKEHGARPVPRTRTVDYGAHRAPQEVPGNRAFLRAQLRRRLVAADVVVTMSNGRLGGVA